MWFINTLIFIIKQHTLINCSIIITPAIYKQRMQLYSNPNLKKITKINNTGRLIMKDKFSLQKSFQLIKNKRIKSRIAFKLQVHASLIKNTHETEI